MDQPLFDQPQLDQLQLGQRMLDQFPDPVVALDPAFNVTYWNRAAAELFGWQAETSLGHNAFCLLGAARTAEQSAALARRLEEQGQLALEHTCLANGGQPLALNTRISALRGEDGRLEGYTAVPRPAAPPPPPPTATPKSDEDEERFQLALEAANMIAWEWNMATNRLAVTGNFAELYGLQNINRGEDAVRLVHHDDLHQHLQVIKRVLGSPGRYDTEFRIVRPDTGEVAWLEEWCVSIPGPDGRVQKLIGVAKDITERKLTERRLQESLHEQEQIAERFRTSVESLLDGYAIFTAIRQDGQIVDFRFEYINETGCRMNSRTYEEQVGHTLLELLPAHRQNGLFERYVALVETGLPVEVEEEEYEDQFGGKRLRRTFENRAVKLGDGFVLTWRDISQRKRSEEQIKVYAEKLKQSNEDLERFAFVASHDLQEPLRKIKLFGNSLRRLLGKDLSDEAADHLARMQKASERMGEMINGLLELSRVNTRGDNFEAIDLTILVEDVLSDLEPRIQSAGGQVRLEKLPEIEADVLQMRQLLQNLISNALKFHQPGRPPVVQISGEITQPARERKPHLVLKVADNGIGFDVNHLSRILQPFQRLNGRAEYEGTGIGLAICKRIIERHHGKISATSQPGQGTTFEIILPVKQSGGPGG